MSQVKTVSGKIGGHLEFASKMFFYQTLSTMTDTYQRATQDEEMTKSMKDFCNFFAKKLELSEK